MDNSNFYSTSQVAKLLNRSEQTVRHWRKINEGPPFIKDPMGRVHYKKTDVEKWMNSDIK